MRSGYQPARWMDGLMVRQLSPSGHQPSHSAHPSCRQVDYLFAAGGTYGQNPQAWEEYTRFIQETSQDWQREKTNLLGA